MTMLKSLAPSNSLTFSRCFSFWMVIGILVPEFSRGQFYPSEPIVPENRLSQLRAIIQNSSNTITNRNHACVELANLYYNKPRKRYEDLDKAADYARRAYFSAKSSQNQELMQRATTFIALVAIEKGDLNQAEKQLVHLDGRFKVGLLVRLAYAYYDFDNDFKADDWTKAIKLANLAMEKSIKMRDPINEILAHQIIALVHAKQQGPLVEKELLDIIDRLKKAGSLNYPSTYAALSEYNFYIGDQSRALAYSLQAVKAMDTTKNYSMAGDIYANHAIMWTDNDEYYKGFNYIQLALKHYSKRAGHYNLSNPKLLFNVEYIYGKTDNYRDDLRRTRKHLANTPPQNSSEHIYHNVIMGNIYRRLKDYSKSEIYYKRAYTLSKKYGKHLLTTTSSLAQVYTDSKQFAKARPFLYEELKFPEVLISNGGKRHLHYMTYLTDSATGHYFEAMNHLAICSGIGLYNLTRAREREVQRLRIAYESQQKEDVIKIKNQNIKLLSQNAKIQEERLRNATLTSTMAGIVVMFLIIIFVLFYSRYRQNSRNSREIGHKNTIITEKNQVLEHLLVEKEWLVKEIHHRVKNNLHTILCLLESQASYLDNDALKALETSQNRIYAMSLIHQKLYQSDDIKTIDMKSYLAEFLSYLSESFEESDHIRIIQEIDAIKLPSSQAIPLALIINESVTNAFKHAFSKDFTGLIRVKLQRQDGNLLLTVEDNGVGWNEGNYNDLHSLGIQLMKGLSEDIGAQIHFENKAGTRMSLILTNSDLKAEIAQEALQSLDSVGISLS